ncbi:unnamed protein product [Owenia fusiformis]|uniref:Uncharacterized protein n=1 Tax=Owenia fusiformis TaxID=6347 RepID=A0A8J1UBB8_OWEFU|nr:unnamed protein product [Owenia fusiformis]
MIRYRPRLHSAYKPQRTRQDSHAVCKKLPPKIKTFEISFSQCQGVFHAGGAVQGHVKIEFTEAIRVRVITVRIVGRSKVFFGPRRGREYRYQMREEYFDETMVLTEAELESFMHKPGVSYYEFMYPLAMSLASSFEGEHGYVRYMAQATLEMPDEPDLHIKKGFTVLSVLDLNEEKNVKDVALAEVSKTLCCLCCATGPITATIKIPRRGWVPGEYIPVMADVDNCSKRKILNTKIVLTQHVRYSGKVDLSDHGQTNLHSRVVAFKERGEIPPGENELWKSEMMRIPPVPPSRLVGCDIIHINYDLSLVVQPEGPAYKISVPIDITIGTEPLKRDSESSDQLSPITSSDDRKHENEEHAKPPVPQADVIAEPPVIVVFEPQQGHDPIPESPPSYEECIFGRVEIDEGDAIEPGHGPLNYTPMYTYYNWKTMLRAASKRSFRASKTSLRISKENLADVDTAHVHGSKTSLAENGATGGK